MLQNMANKIDQEGAAEKVLYDKYMCYCKNAGSTLQASIDAAEAKVPQVESSLKEAESSKVQMEQELKDHQAARADAKASMAAASALRTKEASAYAAEKAEFDSNIAALGGAIASIEKGVAGFLQTNVAKTVQRLALADNEMRSFDRQMVLSFLAGGDQEGYAPQSGQITGILKEMKDDMEKDLSDSTATEKAAISSYDELMSAKTKEVNANTKAIESKSTRVGELGVQIAEMKIDLDDTSAALAEDKKFLANMDSTCAAKSAEWEKIKKARSEEIVALMETIKILNDDDALEIFKKTLPGASSFVQTVATAQDQQRRALALVRAVREFRPHAPGRTSVDFIALALTGRKVNFAKVIKMIENMVGILGEEQEEDDMKKEYCEKQFDHADDKKKGLEQDVKDLEATMDDTKETISTLVESLKALSDGIKALDKEVAESTETRKSEHEAYTELLSSDTAATELLAMAKNRLNKYYNPKLYQPDAALVQIRAHSAIYSAGSQRAAPAPPPESFKAYSKSSEEGTGVIAMIDRLVADLQKEMTEAEVAEKDAQKEYEQFMSDAAEKRATDSKAVTDKEGYKADAETDLEAAKEGHMDKFKELMATDKYISNLHGECDWLMTNFEIRKEARAGEVEALKNAKAVLSGADVSLLQRATRSLRGA